MSKNTRDMKGVLSMTTLAHDVQPHVAKTKSKAIYA